MESCRRLYNHFLAERKDSWENDGKSISMYDQHRELPALKVHYPNLKDVYSATLQQVAERVDLAFKAFFRRIREGVTPDKVGYPRFKGYGRYDSLSYKQYNSGIKIKDNRLVLSGIGHVKTVFHRPLEGTPKTASHEPEVIKNMLSQLPKFDIIEEWKKDARTEGKAEGKVEKAQTYAIRLLTKKFGKISKKLENKINKCNDMSKLDQIPEVIFDVNDIKEIEKLF